MQLDRKSLAFGQLPSTKGDLYSPATGNKGLVHNIVLHNANTTAETVVLNYHDGTNEYEIFNQSLAVDETLIWDFRGAGDVVEDGGKYTGNTTTASKVTYKVNGTEETPNAASAGGSVVGVSSNLWAPPASPHALDMEFDTDTIDAAWSVQEVETPAVGSISSGTVDAYDSTFNSGTAVRINQNPADRPSWMLLQAPSRSPYRRFAVYRPITLTTNMLIWARMKFGQRATSATAEDGYAGLTLSLANAGVAELKNTVEMFLNEQDSGVVKANSRFRTGTGSAGGNTNTSDVDFQGQALEYVAIHKVGTDYHTWAGTAGGNWIHVATYDSGDVPYTPDLLWVHLSNVDTTPGPRVVGVDFIRFIETDNFLL
jgi:hypothetical protein